MAKNKFINQMIIALLIAVGGWAIFNFVVVIMKNILNNIGITSEAGQSLAIVVIVISILLSLGYGFRKSIQKLVK